MATFSVTEKELKSIRKLDFKFSADSQHGAPFIVLGWNADEHIRLDLDYDLKKNIRTGKDEKVYRKMLVSDNWKDTDSKFKIREFHVKLGSRNDRYYDYLAFEYLTNGVWRPTWDTASSHQRSAPKTMSESARGEATRAARWFLDELGSATGTRHSLDNNDHLKAA